MAAPLVLANRDFGKIWLGQVLSQSGTRMYQMAIVWWIVSSSRAEVGRVAGVFLVVSALPSVLFVHWIGRLVDSRRTKVVLLAADGLNTLVVSATAIGLWLWPDLPMGFVYAAGFAISALQAVTDPSFGKAVSEVVEPERLEEATAFQTSALSLGFFLGAALGGSLIPFLGVAGVVALNAVTYLISFIGIAAARFRFEAPTPRRGEKPAHQVSAWRVLADYPLFKKLLLGMGFINFFTVPTFVILPLYVSRVLGAGAATLGWIESGIWLGIIIGTVLSRRMRISENAEVLGAVSSFFLGVGLLAPGLIVSGPFFFAMALLQGTAFAFIPVRFIALFQEGLPIEAKGRFFALMSAILSATPPLSQFVAGTLSDFVPVTMLCLLQGGGAFAISLYFLAPASRLGFSHAFARGESAA